MRVEEALTRIRFYTGTLSDISGKAVNNLFTNKQILYLLMTNLNQYANITKAIEDVYSFTLNTNTPFVSAPILALRSEAYKFIMIVINGRYFPADIQGFGNSYVNFPVRSSAGITNWLLPWGTGGNTRFSVFPLNSQTPFSSTISADITATDTTIPMVSTSGLVSNEGRITIGSEKILYSAKTSTSLTGCVRGVESTTASAHTSGDTVYENNVYLFYSRLHTPITIQDDNFVPLATQQIELEVAEEHLEGILKHTSYDLLIKVDPTRAEHLKVNSDQLFEQYRLDIRKGRSRIKSGSNIRSPYMYESGAPMYTNLL